MRYLCSLILAMLIVSPLCAQDKKSYDECMDDALANYEIRECNADRVERLDNELNQVWREAYRPIAAGSGAKITLLNEQRKWIEFKDNACTFWHYGFGTAGRDMFFYDCHAKIIEQRIETLHKIAAFPAGNLTDISAYQRCNSGVGVDMTEIYRKSHASGMVDICARQFFRLEQADAELNRVWREIRAEWREDDDNPETAWGQLLNGQRKWVSWKENACEYYPNEADRWGCISDMTEARTDMLKEFINPDDYY